MHFIFLIDSKCEDSILGHRLLAKTFINHKSLKKMIIKYSDKDLEFKVGEMYGDLGLLVKYESTKRTVNQLDYSS